MLTEFSVRVILLSDWHVGSGESSAGTLDRTVARDPDDLPYIPAKTLTGIWRDACETVAWGLDNGTQGSWSAWVDYLFGSQPAIRDGQLSGDSPPRPAALSVRPAGMVGALRIRLRGKANRVLRDALTFVKPGIRIDEASDAAQSKFLRFEEMARAGAVLETSCSLELPKNDELRKSALALLVAGARFVERLGGKRRRGSGRCKLEVASAGISHEEAIAWLKQHAKAPEVPSSLSPTPQQANVIAFGGPDEWVEIPVRLHVKLPLAVSYRTVGNVGETLDFLPGRYLLAVFSRRLRNEGIDIGPAIARGDMLFLPCTLAVEGAGGLPLPLALGFAKSSQEPQRAINRFLLKGDYYEPLKERRSGYVAVDRQTSALRYENVARVLRTHNIVDDTQQRPTEDTGGVYTYEAIQPGTELLGMVRLRRGLHERLSQAKPNWWKLVEGCGVSFGRSRKDDYGLVDLEVDAPRPPTSGDGPGIDEGQELVVWCLSDVVLSDSHLRPATSVLALKDALEQAFGGVVRLDEQKEKVFLRTRRHDSWHGRWGFPRPTITAIAAGSCAAFVVRSGTLSREQLQAAALSGIGERRAEGYGQVSFNDNFLMTQKEIAVTKPDTRTIEAQEDTAREAPADTELPDDVLDFARSVETATWRSLIRRRVRERAADEKFREETLGWPQNSGKPPASQLGSLREAVRSTTRAGTNNAASLWVGHVKEVETRREEWPEESLVKVQNLVSDPDRIWGLLMEDGEAWPTLTSEGSDRLRMELWAEAVQALFDEAIRQHQRSRERRKAARGQGAR